MKNIIAKGLLSGIISGLLFACNAKKDEPAAEVVIDKEQIKKEIQAKEDSFAAVYNSGQMRSIGYYADDAVNYFQNRLPIVGKDSILAFLAQDIITKDDRIAFKTNEVFVSNDGNLVVELGSFVVLDTLSNPLNMGNYMTLFEKRSGKYVAVREMSASDGSIQR